LFSKSGGLFQVDKDGVGEWMTKSDIRLAEERVKRLEKEVKLFKMWYDRGGDLRERIIRKVLYASPQSLR